jgi:hypothetical protein
MTGYATLNRVWDAFQKPCQGIVAIAALRPTQITLGMREVRIKRERWRNKHRHNLFAFARKHAAPVVLGLGRSFYLIDHHHLMRALGDEGVVCWPVEIVADLSDHSEDALWLALHSRGWTHPFDDAGRPRNFSDIPRSLSDLVDDPFRSLAGALKRSGGYKKGSAPFSEFRWADFLRTHIEREMVERDFDLALEMATNLATSDLAKTLPGWRGLAISAPRAPATSTRA